MNASAQQVSSAEIRPFRVDVPETDLTELRKRINATRWPDRETVSDATQGVQLATIQALARYWATDYDWRKVEARLNAVPNFITEIDGLDIHFIHVRSKHENALPLIVTHGWPGSIIEQMKIIEPLTNPTAHGGSASDAFHVVIPSMPGYGFSGKPTTTGWDPAAHRARLDRADEAPRVHASTWRKAAIGARSSPSRWACRRLRNCSASTPTCPARFQPTSTRRRSRARRRPPVSRPTRRSLTSVCNSSTRRASATRFQMGLRPQTLYGIADSPVGLAAYFLDHDQRSYELIARVFAGQAATASRATTSSTTSRSPG